MVKNKIFIIGFIVAVFSVVFIWNNTQVQVHKERMDKPIKLPSQVSGVCGIESCHGLDISCGPNVPEVCNEIYMVGDNCRQFATCQTIDGLCTLNKSPRFDSCKVCTEKCKHNYPNDPENAMECASKCAE